MRRTLSLLIAGVMIATMPNTLHANMITESNINNISVGGYVFFGNYPQTDITGEQLDPIKWRVLAVEDGKALLMADQNLDVYKYNATFGETDWSRCTLRNWLNNDFYNKAFDENEQNKILATLNENKANSKYNVGATSSTEDKVFVLSEEELTNPQYGFSSDLGNDVERVRTNTDFVSAGGSVADEEPGMQLAGKPDWYWTRTMGQEVYQAEYVMADGTISQEGDLTNHINVAICPAVWIKLTKDVPPEESTQEEETTSIEEITSIKETTTTEKSTELSTSVENTTKEKKYKVKNTVIRKIYPKRKAVVVKWKKVSSVTGYQIKYGTTRKLTKGKIKTIKRMKTVSVKISRLKSKKVYYIKIRTYKGNGKRRNYSTWSKVRRIRVK